jgi:RNase P protein component
MLAKKNRLTKSEVEYVMKYGTVVRTSEFYIRYSAAVKNAIIETLRVPKFAVVVPKKIEKTSVARHALKRAVYDVVVPLIVEFPTIQVHVVLSALQPHRALFTRGAYQTVVSTLRKEIFDV